MTNEEYYSIWGRSVGLTGEQVGKLVQLSDAAYTVQVDWHNSVDSELCKVKVDEAISKFEEYAKSLGFGTVWHGLLPTLIHPERGEMWLAD